MKKEPIIEKVEGKVKVEADAKAKVKEEKTEEKGLALVSMCYQITGPFEQFREAA